MKNKGQLPSLAFFVISTHLGGAEKSLLDFIVPLKKNDNTDFVVVVPKDSGPLLGELDRHGVTYVVLSLPPLLLSLSRKTPLRNVLIALPCSVLLFIFMAKVSRFIKNHDIQTIHSTGIKFHIILGLLSNWQNFSLVIHMRDIVTSSFLKNILLAINKAKSVQFISNSRATARSLSPLTSKVIYNGFDETRFTHVPNHSIHKSFSLPADSLVIGTVGVIARWKGQREFVEMAAQLAPQLQNTFFLIVGSEIYDTQGEIGERRKLEELVKLKGLESRVLFVDFQKDIERIYNSLDIFVHCSITPEPFGRVVVEAMLCGCPVVAANAGGPSEFVENEVNGLLYKLNDTEAMAQAVKSLILRPEKRKLISEQATEIRNQFSLASYHSNLKETLNIDS